MAAGFPRLIVPTPVHTPRLINSLWVAGGLSAALATASLHQPPVRLMSVPTLAILSDSISDRADAGRIRGAPNATLWVIEAGDFQCPVCKAWHDQYFATLIKDYVSTGKVRFAFLNYPLSQHKYARAAAEAVMCASVQSKFWEMHDAVYATQNQWVATTDPQPIFESLAAKTGVNMTQWRSCVSTHATAGLIQADYDRNRKIGANQTPTFFVGNRKFGGPYPLDSIGKAIDQALAKAATH